MILVVDDNVDLREMVCMCLEEDGYQTAGAGNGQEAMDWLHSAAVPSVILLDLTMPVMDGNEFLTVKEADPALADVPVVVMTAMHDCSQILLDHQVTEFLPKPLSTRALLDAIGRARA